MLNAVVEKELDTLAVEVWK